MMKKISIAIAFMLSVGFYAKADEGMWMINMINKALEKKMVERGLELSANEIYNADAEGATLADAVVSMEFGCTGSIISDEGLLITNHHCAYGDVHSISTPEHNYLEEGFWAMRSSEERVIPGKTVWFLKKVVDMTDEVTAFVEEQKAQGRNAGMRRISHQLEKKYSEESGLTAYLSGMWRGSRYYMAFYEVYKDVRLVAAPPVSIAAYGGDIDNWEWPQHKCDFAMYRVYAAPDGSPADYSEENVPMKPVNKLEISLAGYKPGDFTMVIGYPGSTDRYASSFDVNYMETLRLPISNRLRGKQMEIINSWMSRDPEIRLKYSDHYFSLSNVQELNMGQVKCYRRFDVVEAKQEQEKELQSWIDSDPERKEKWGNIIPLLAEKYAAAVEAEKDVTYYRETLVIGTRMSRIAGRINNLESDVFKEKGIDVRKSGKKACKDSSYVNCCREYRFCARKYPSVKKFMLRDIEAIDLRVERDLFRQSVAEFFTNVDPEYFGGYQKELLAEFTSADGKCDYLALADKVWNESFFTDEKKLESMLDEEHCLDEFYADPLYRFFQDVRIVDFNSRISRLEGTPNIISIEREYTHALYQMREDKGVVQYPDANSTMRITYGTVGSLQPFDAVSYGYQSKTGGILEKYDPSSYDFNLDERQKSLLESEDWGRWGVHAKKGTLYMPVDFLTDNDITGGNSGSPVLNAKGQLIGLAFDGNKESLASDAAFIDGYNKCVCVDIRYILWVLDKYAGMERIIDELGF